MNMVKVIGDEFPEYISYQMSKIFLVLEDVYSVGTPEELQEAIDSIGTGSGTIFIEAGTHEITVPIDIDNCGSIVIYGHGDNTVLKAADGITVFNITCCASCLIKTLKIDASNYTLFSLNLPVILVNEGLDNVVGFQDVTIEGLNNFGRGIELQSNNCMVEHCNITLLSYGINITSDHHIISQNTVSINEIGIYQAGSYCNITGNTCNNNTTIGIYVVASLYSNISNNRCNFNPVGISVNGSHNNTISNNIASSNTFHGIYTVISNYNTLSGNTTDNNDSNSVGNTAGIYIAGNCDFNTISANSSNNNNNIGAGTAYGIFISAATCNENVVAANNANGNDVDFMDSGTATTIEYYVQDSTELQDAIDSIGTKAGIINIDASFTVNATIDIDGGGSYIIQGEGSNSTLTLGVNITCFNITNARSVLLQNFKIDAAAYTAFGMTQEIIDVSEVADNLVVIDNVSITGDGSNGCGVEANSENVQVKNCSIDNIHYGIYLRANKCSTFENRISDCDNYGINATGDYCLLSHNACHACQEGIQLNGANYCNVDSNIITTSVSIAGIYVFNLTGGNISNNTVTTTVDGSGIVIDDATYSTFIGNICDDNDESVAATNAGIEMVSNSDNNLITGNSCINNNNTGGGVGYGILVNAATCNNNKIFGNSCTGNDKQYWDNGTNTDIEYRVGIEADLQDAIDSIAAKVGTITITTDGIFTITAAIDVDGGGSYIIQGQGYNTILTPNADIRTLNITSARHLYLKDFRINATAMTTPAKEIINIDEVANNRIFIDNLYIDGDGVNGRGIEINSNNCNITNTTIQDVGSGIVIIGANYNLISNNYCLTNNLHGIYLLNAADANTISDNTLILNKGSGIYIDVSDNNNVSGNNCSLNELNGIYMNDSDLNHLTSNICTGNDSNTVNPQAGILLNAACNDNAIVSNMMNGNNNIGAGIGYGLYIGNANCSDNFLSSNHYSANDVQWKDIGTNTDIIYRCSTGQEIQDAIDSIAAKSGKIVLVSGTIVLTGTIDVNGNGSYIIEGQGENTVIETAAVMAFNITSAKSCILRNFKIDGTAFIVWEQGIYINEASDNIIIIENVTITGDGTNGFGIELDSNNCRIENCKIENMGYGIVIRNNNTILTGNYVYNNLESGIYIGATAHYNNLTSNISNSNKTGIYIATSDYNIILGNICTLNTINGIHLVGCNYNSIHNNICNENDSNDANNNAGIKISNISNYNSIKVNTSNNNNNAGAGTGYGIHISNANCNENVIEGNFCSGNDINYKDVGTNTDIIYRVSNATDFQHAIDSIAGKAGVIKIVGAIANVQATINNATASIVIEGDGEISELDANGDNVVITITTCASLILRDFKIDATDLITPDRYIVWINGGTNILIDNLIIIGDGTNGIGFMINVDEVEVRNCNIKNICRGMHIVNDKCRIIGNYCHNNSLYGISFYTGHQNLINNNICNNNDIHGMRLHTSNYNTIIGNICNENNLDNAADGAGMWIQNNSNYNIISGNTFYGNANVGVGISYGIYIAAADCDFNSIVNNNYSGNDVNWKDVGTNTDIVYKCSTGQEIQDAIDSIAAKSGIITILTGTIALAATIDVDGGGDYIIEGEGVGTVIDCAADRTAFNITSAKSCVLRNFKIDATDVITLARPIIQINEAADNIINISSIVIIGAAQKGYGIYIISDHCIVKDCTIKDTYDGIQGNPAHYSVISNNYIEGCWDGILLNTTTFSMINNNICYNQRVGLIFISASFNTINGNAIYSCVTGIILSTAIKNTITGNNLSTCTIGINVAITSNYNTIVSNICGDKTINDMNDWGGINIINDSSYNMVSGNMFFNLLNTGAGGYYGVNIDNATNINNNIGLNQVFNCNGKILNNGTNTIIIGDDTAYGVGWLNDLGTPTKNAIYNYFGIGWSGWFDDGVNFRITVVNGIITAVANSTGGGHNP